ncbi:methionine adenosyltransferase 2 subunit beta-like [Pollicipes pollicipes]|uniref:methionine adenosyltransferase 2 subunit beta-like n=1 Tax=Pollicipes pollicipes TaxID=41117 RepID=UPI001884D8D1|nr:methionine adenosyltransferase 2 subunit beta-like [Pollicipes pollicipes]
MTRVVITGASGLLGRALVKDFKENGFTVFGLAKSRVSPGLLALDLLDSDALRSKVRELRPDVIIHSAAYRQPDQVEGDAEGARRMNVHVPQVLAELAAELKAQLLYISTDYVFDGVSPPHMADDQPNPLNLYGQTKYEGEQATLKHCPGSLVLRVPILYGPVEYLAESAVTVLFGALLNPPAGGYTVSDLEVRYPAHVRDVAAMCRQLIEKQRQDRDGVFGIFQWSGQEPVTKYALVQQMAALFGLPLDHVSACRTPPASGTRRPMDSRLDTSGLRRLGIGQHVPLAQGLHESLLPWAERQAGDASAGSC